MTGLYEQSLIERRKKARADVARYKKSLQSLKKQESDSADEHRAMLAILEQVFMIYDNAPNTLAPTLKSLP